MPSFNKVILCGHLTRDWELRYAPSGSAIGNNSIAMNRKWKDDEGEEKEEVAFIDLVLFGKSAETASQYQKKGDATLIEGRLRQDVWEDKQSGDKRSRVLVVVERFQFLGGNGKQKYVEEDDDSRAKKRRAEDDDEKPRKQRKHDYDEDEDRPKDRKRSNRPF